MNDEIGDLPFDEDKFVAWLKVRAQNNKLPYVSYREASLSAIQQLSFYVSEKDVRDTAKRLGFSLPHHKASREQIELEEVVDAMTGADVGFLSNFGSLLQE